MAIFSRMKDLLAGKMVAAEDTPTDQGEAAAVSDDEERKNFANSGKWAAVASAAKPFLNAFKSLSQSTEDGAETQFSSVRVHVDEQHAVVSIFMLATVSHTQDGAVFIPFTGMYKLRAQLARIVRAADQVAEELGVDITEPEFYVKPMTNTRAQVGVMFSLED